MLLLTVQSDSFTLSELCSTYNKKTTDDLFLIHRDSGRLQTCGMWHHVVWWIGTGISEESVVHQNLRSHHLNSLK